MEPGREDPALAAAVGQVQAAVQLLYAPGAPPEQQAGANAWLNAWAGSADAWQVAQAALYHKGSSVEVGPRLCSAAH